VLAIRLQRTGRSGHSQFRVIVQDSRFSPTRGRVVAYLGSYDPHTKAAAIDSQKASQYLENGAQPSDRVARLMQKEGIKLPGWVKLEEPQKRTTRNPDKRRSTRPAQPETPAAEAPIEDAPAEADTPAETETVPESKPSPEAPAAETVEEPAPAQPEAPAEAGPAEETSA
jgi:small subunit ribosomal protein S16